MKIIEALKKIKDLRRKSDDLKDKLKTYCADMDCNTPTYPDQRGKIAEWLQGHNDIIKEIAHLKLAIRRTNLMTLVPIEFEGTFVTKSICSWIDRRKELAKLQEDTYRSLTNKGMRDSSYQVTTGAPIVPVKVIMYFDPNERDKKIELYRSEPAKIDSTLEIINAVTELIEN